VWSGWTVPAYAIRENLGGIFSLACEKHDLPDSARPYINLLSASAILTAGFVIGWPMNNNDIDPGEPNARSEQ
jgi:hypothetical protein